MDFLEDFKLLTPDYFCTALIFLLVVTAGACGIRRFLGPIALASLYFYGAVLLMMGAGSEQLVQGVILVCIFLMFLMLGSRSPVLRVPRGSLSVDNGATFYRDLTWVLIIVYVLFVQLLISDFSMLYKIDKINWVVNAGALPYVWSLLNGALISVAFMLLVVRRYLLFSIVALALAFGGYIFGEKSVFINLAVLIAVVVFQEPLKLGRSLVAAVAATFFLAFTIVYSFGGAVAGWSTAVQAFSVRLIATFDGTMIILKTHMYEGYELPHSVIYYVFDFFLSKIYGVSPGVGQILAAAGVYQYPENGGPNDSLVNYFLLSDISGKISVGVFLAVFAFFLGFLDRVVKEKRLNDYVVGWQFILIPLYLLMPAFFQATGTAFILLARYYVLLLPLVLVVYFIKGMVSRVKR